MFTLLVTPRFGDVDVLGHINNTTPALWFELARNPVFRIFSPDLTVTREAWPLIMAHTDFDFVGELFFGADIEIRTFISKIGVKSFTAYHEAWQNGRLCVTGSAVMVYYDFAAKKSAMLPMDKRALLSEHLLPGAQETSFGVSKTPKEVSEALRKASEAQEHANGSGGGDIENGVFFKFHNKDKNEGE